MSNKILVIGGNGKTGRKIVTRLEAQGADVRIGSRSGSPAFDWEDASTWEAAFEGVNKAYITFQPDLAVPGALDAIEGICKVAKKAQVEKLVLLSGKGEREAELCEQAVMSSGLNYTIVRASWFNQNFSESFFLDPVIAGHVALPQANVPIPFVDTDDIADVAVEALLNDEHNGNIYQLTGPRLLTFKDVVAEIAKASGRDVSFTPITVTAYTDMMKEQGVPEEFVWLVGYLFTEVLGGESISEQTNDIEKVLGRKPKDFTQYAAEVAATGLWNQTEEAAV